MTTVHVDLQDGAGGSVTADGWEIERTAHISGLTGLAYARLKQAADALRAKNVWVGRSHPSITQAQVADISFEHESGSVVKATANYREPDWSGDTTDPETDDPEHQQIEVGSSLQQITTDVDREGNPIWVGLDADGERNKTGKQLSVLRPLSAIVVRRRESRDPGAKSQEYSGSVNSVVWKLAPTRSAPRTWMCMGIDGVSTDGGATWNVTYAFEYAPGTWDIGGVLVDENTGEPFKEAVENPAGHPHASKTFEMNPLKNFNNLRLI